MEKYCISSWSGGKDSYFALLKAMRDGWVPKALLNVLNEEGKISRSHGIPESVLLKQAASLGLPLETISSSWGDYEVHFTAMLQNLKSKYSISTVVFGDIDLDGHRQWEEKVCRNANLEALLPLWQRNRKELVLSMLNEGIEACIVSCNEMLGPDFLGQKLTPQLIDSIESLGADACGENGEYHTLVVNGPGFNNRISIIQGEKLLYNGYWFLRLS